MVKFGARVRTCDSLPMQNLVKIAQGECPLRGKFSPKFEIFAILSFEPTYL